MATFTTNNKLLNSIHKTKYIKNLPSNLNFLFVLNRMGKKRKILIILTHEIAVQKRRRNTSHFNPPCLKKTCNNATYTIRVEKWSNSDMEVGEKSMSGMYVRVRIRIKNRFFVEVFTRLVRTKKAIERKKALAITMEYVFHPTIFPNKA